LVPGNGAAAAAVPAWAQNLVNPILARLDILDPILARLDMIDPIMAGLEMLEPILARLDTINARVSRLEVIAAMVCLHYSNPHLLMMPFFRAIMGQLVMGTRYRS
jgi:hypothetical protein